jgi:hypothetical protein
MNPPLCPKAGDVVRFFNMDSGKERGSLSHIFGNKFKVVKWKFLMTRWKRLFTILTWTEERNKEV